MKPTQIHLTSKCIQAPVFLNRNTLSWEKIAVQWRLKVLRSERYDCIFLEKHKILMSSFSKDYSQVLF